MLIDRFGAISSGSLYANAYPLIHSGEQDDWTITRPPVTTNLAGADGAFDFYGTVNYPRAPMTVSKSFMATASTWVGVGAELDNLAYNTIYVGEGRLWALEGTVHYWTWAKCTALDLGFKVDGNSPPYSGTAVFGQEVSIEFFCRTGEWYAEGASETAYTPAFDVKLLDGSNNVLTGGTIANVLSVSCEERLDEAGAVSFTVPATDTTVATLLSTAARFRIDFTGGTAVYGIIDKDVIDATAQQPTRTVYGANMLRELQHYTMGWWCFFDDKDIVNDVLPKIVADTGWSVSTVDSSGKKIYYRFDGDTRLAALIKIAEATGKHFRLTNTFRQLEWGDFFGGPSGVTFYGLYNSGNYVSFDGMLIIGSLEITSDRAPVVNRVIPWGAGQDEGNLNRAKVSLFHLTPGDSRWDGVKAKAGIRGAQATITSVGQNNDGDPHIYNVDSSTGFMATPITQLLWCYDPNNLKRGIGYDFVVKEVASSTRVLARGSPTLPALPSAFPAYLISDPQLYLEDATAYAADPHEAVVIFDDITLTDLGLPAFALAAAQLYDRAAQYLETHKVPQVSYALSVYNCPDSLRAGDVVHITYTGEVTRNAVTVGWVNIDTDLNVINITRRYNADGSKEATIEVSNVKTQAANTSGALSRAVGSVGYHATTVGALGGYAVPTDSGVQGSVVTPAYLYLVLADDATAIIATAAAGLGTVFVISVEDSSVAMFSLTGANHAAYEMLDPQQQYTATSGTDGYTNVYCEASAPYSYYIENKRGGSRAYYIWMHMAIGQ